MVELEVAIIKDKRD